MLKLWRLERNDIDHGMNVEIVVASTVEDALFFAQISDEERHNYDITEYPIKEGTTVGAVYIE